MQRIDHFTASPNLFGTGKAGFSSGNPSISLPSTRLTPDWCNDVQENIVRVIEAAGIGLVKGDGDQLLDAINAFIAASGVSGLKALAYLDIGQGLENDGAGNLRVKLNGTSMALSAAGLSVNPGSLNVWSGTQSGTEVTLTSSMGVIGWNLAAAQNAKIVLNGSATLGAPTNIVNGTYYSLLVIQPATGGPYTLAFNAAYTNVATLTLSTAANAIDHLVFRATAGALRLVSATKNVGTA